MYVRLHLQVFGAVGGGVQVRHGADRSIAAVCRRPGAGQDGFLIRKSRLAQMNMYIRETGHYINRDGDYASQSAFNLSAPILLHDGTKITATVAGSVTGSMTAVSEVVSAQDRIYRPYVYL